MSLLRDRAIMGAVGLLTAADLDRFGVLEFIKAQSKTVEIEDIDFVEGNVVASADHFQCLGAVYFTHKLRDGDMSDDILVRITGTLANCNPTITSLALLEDCAEAA